MIAGGLFAAPLAGLMVKRMAEKTLLRMVGLLTVVLAGLQTWQAAGLHF